MPNVELFKKILAQVTAHPETHDQSTWVETSPYCGTTRCAAGWAVALSKGENEGDYDFRRRYVRERNLHFGWSYGNVGQHLLGIDDDQADALFYGADDAEAVELIREYAAGGDPRP